MFCLNYRDDIKQTIDRSKMLNISWIGSSIDIEASRCIPRSKPLKLTKNLKTLWYKGKYRDLKMIPWNPFVRP